MGAPSKSEEEKTEFLIEEYKEACADIRHYSNFRSWQMAGFIAVTGAALAVFFNDNVSTSHLFRLIIASLGIVVAFSFFIQDRRAVDYFDAYLKHAKELEERLGLSRLSIGVPPPFLRIKSRYATWMLYGSVLISWLVLIALTICKTYLTCG